jgi:hypothetical protein
MADIGMHKDFGFSLDEFPSFVDHMIDQNMVVDIQLNPEETEPWRTIDSAIAGLLQSRSIKLPTLTGASQGPQRFTNLQWTFLQAHEITEKGKGNRGKIIQLLRLNQMLNSEDVTVDALERMSISNPCRGGRPVGGALHLLVIGMSSPL